MDAGGHVHRTIRDDCELSTNRQHGRCAQFTPFGPGMACAGVGVGSLLILRGRLLRP